MDENRGRRSGADIEGGRYLSGGDSEYAAVAAISSSGGEEDDSAHQVRRTPSALLAAAFGRLSPTGGGEVTRRSSRWSWTSSLDLRLFGKVTRSNGRVDSALMEEQRSETDGGSSRYVSMGVAL